MLTPDTGIFLQILSDSSERVLKSATVVSQDDGQITVKCDEPGLPVEAGTETLVYYDRGREFLQQAIRVDAILESDPDLVLSFDFTGDAVSAEGRQCFRVSTVVADLTAKVGSEVCSLMDVSATGMSVVSSSSYKAGERLKLTLTHDGKSFEGMATVQSVKELPDGRTRFGFHCADKKNLALSNGLLAISMSVQRQQLRRRAGTS